MKLEVILGRQIIWKGKSYRKGNLAKKLKYYDFIKAYTFM